jgi:fucose permease
MTPSFFFIALTVGRSVAPLLLRRFRELTVARSGLLIACAGMTSLVSAHTLTSVVASATIIGFGLSSVYPITISLLSRRFETASARAGSITFNMANFGGATLPFCVGYAGQHFGGLKMGLLVPLAAGILMLALYRIGLRE